MPVHRIFYDDPMLSIILSSTMCCQVPDSTWWTKVLLKALDHHKISYALAWRNAGGKPSGQSEYYLPYIGQISAKDFFKFSREPGILFQREVTKANLYQ